MPCPTTKPFHRLPPIRLQFSSRTGAQQLPLPAPHPHLLHRPHPRPPFAPWHTTSAPLVSNLEPAWILCRWSPRLTRLPLLASPAIEALLGSLAAACLASSRSSLRQRQSIDSAAAELESTAAEVGPAVADLKSAAAEVESCGAGAPISGGGGRIDGGGVDPAAAVLQSAAALPELTAAGRPTLAREQPCPRKTHLLLLPFVLHGLHSVRGWAVSAGQIRI